MKYTIYELEAFSVMGQEVELNIRSQKKLTWEKYLNILRYNPIVEPKIYVSTW